MTENNIVHSLGCCRAGDCVNCTFSNDTPDQCRSKLLGAAMQIINLQKERLEHGSDKMKKLQDDNRRLQVACRFTFGEVELVKAVNEIVHYCLDNDEDEEGDQDRNIIRSMLDFGKMLPSKGHLVIRPNMNAPELKLGR